MEFKSSIDFGSHQAIGTRWTVHWIKKQNSDWVRSFVVTRSKSLQTEGLLHAEAVPNIGNSKFNVVQYIYQSWAIGSSTVCPSTAIILINPSYLHLVVTSLTIKRKCIDFRLIFDVMMCISQAYSKLNCSSLYPD